MRCPAPSRSSSTPVATRRRSSVPIRPTASSGGSSPGSMRSACPRAWARHGPRPPRIPGTMAETGIAEQAASNGHARTESSQPGFASRLVGGLARSLQGRIPAADLDERDPDYIRDSLPRLWLAASLYFRGEVRGLGNIPETGPVLLVGNHSGGNLTPDTSVFTLAFGAYFGVERAFYQLAHNLVLSLPGLGALRKYGTVAASPENARKALESGAALLVYPGGDYEVHRPSWERNKVDFDGRKGFIRLALEHDVPIVPVVSVGGQETALFLSRGERLPQLPAPAPMVPPQGPPPP